MIQEVRFVFYLIKVSMHCVLTLQMMEVDIFTSEPDVLMSAVK